MIIAASVVVIAVLAVALWTTLDSLEKSLKNLDERVKAIENKTWHPVGNFILSPSKASETFNITGEKWRMSFTFNFPRPGSVQLGYNLRVTNIDGYIVGGLSGAELLGLRDSGKGTLYIQEGQGEYSVEIVNLDGDYTLSFSVETYY
jgi:hypothetical protein